MIHEAWIQPESQDPEAMSHQVEQSMDHQSILAVTVQHTQPDDRTAAIHNMQSCALRQSGHQHAAELASVGASIVVPSIPISPAASPVLPGTTLNARALTFLARI